MEFGLRILDCKIKTNKKDKDAFGLRILDWESELKAIVQNRRKKEMNEEQMKKRTKWGNILDPDYAAGADLGFNRPADTDNTYLAPQPEAEADHTQEQEPSS